jgi:hypothetical protein
MLDIVYAGSVRRFVERIDGIAQRLEFADELGGDQWPMAGDIVSLRRLLCDLRAAAVYRGRTGASDYGLAAQVVEQLTAVVEAHDANDLAPWRSCRGSVLASVATLRQLCQPEHDDLVVRSAVPAAPAPRPSPAKTIIQERDRGEKVGTGEKGPAGPRGRPPKEPGATREAEAAWWRDRAHEFTEDGGDDEPAITDQSEEDTLEQLYGRMTEWEVEFRLRQLGAEEPPEWWPKGPDGRRVDVVRFRERWEGIRPKTWAKYVQRFDNESLRGRGITPRHHQGNVEPANQDETKKPIKITDAGFAIRVFEKAAGIASSLVGASSKVRGKLFDDLRRCLARVGITGPDADEILEREPAEMVEEFESRRRNVEKSQAGTKTRR